MKQGWGSGDVVIKSEFEVNVFKADDCLRISSVKVQRHIIVVFPIRQLKVGSSNVDHHIAQSGDRDQVSVRLEMDVLELVVQSVKEDLFVGLDEFGTDG